jgi:alkanesulfonate monooxygenase SsuD/methylene tetrahydromethanopterin reductase-like flavin-dependent oxidoreductase (luciferase family)
VSAPPRVSVIIPHAMRFSAADLTAFARHAEDAGLDGVFVGDHLTPAVPVPDSTLALAAAAAVTSRVRLGFGVMVLGLRHPAWAARQVATLQQLSGNRVILGVGLGGSAHGAAAWQAVGVPHQERGADRRGACRPAQPDLRRADRPPERHGTDAHTRHATSARLDRR